MDCMYTAKHGSVCLVPVIPWGYSYDSVKTVLGTGHAHTAISSGAAKMARLT